MKRVAEVREQGIAVAGPGQGVRAAFVDGGRRVKALLVTARGTVRADQVLVATSGYTRRPLRWHQVRIAPVGSFVIVTEPLGKDVCDTLLPNRRMVSNTLNLLNYFRITPDTGCCSAAAPGSPCPTSSRTRRAGASCTRR